VDLRLDHLNQRLEKIASLLSYNPKLTAALDSVNASQGAIRQKEAELAALEQVSESKKIKIEQSEASLYNGKNTNPKELKDLQTEIDSLKRSVSTIEENQISLMAILDDLAQNLSENKAAYSVVLGESEQENQTLFNENSELEKEKEKLFKERQAATGQIQAEILQTYEKLRPAKNHIAVTTIEEQSCATCGSEITASDIQKARTASALSYCPSCGRIIYAG
jgi:hypothetical protein